MTKEQQGKYYIKDYELDPMPPYSNYPDALVKAIHAKSLIGPDGGIPEKDIAASAFMLDPGTYYGAHAHMRPEIYIFLSGTAECEWGDETFTAGPGTVTYCPPYMSHAMRATSTEPVRTIIINWAPNGDQKYFETGAYMISTQG